MSDQPMQFPILTLMQSYGGWAEDGVEAINWFFTDRSFTSLDSSALKHGTHAGMLVIDQAGRNWRVTKVTDLGPDGQGVWGFLARILGDHRVKFDMVEETPPLTFEAVKERVCISIQASPDTWRDDEAIAGEDGPPRDEQEMLDELTAKARAAKSMLELVAVLDFNGND